MLPEQPGSMPVRRANSLSALDTYRDLAYSTTDNTYELVPYHTSNPMRKLPAITIDNVIESKAVADSAASKYHERIYESVPDIDRPREPGHVADADVADQILGTLCEEVQECAELQENGTSVNDFPVIMLI